MQMNISRSKRESHWALVGVSLSRDHAPVLADRVRDAMCLGVYGPGSPTEKCPPQGPSRERRLGREAAAGPAEAEGSPRRRLCGGAGAGPTQGRGTATGTLVSAESPRQRSVLTPSAPPLRGGRLSPHEQVGTATLQAGHRKSVEPPGALGAAGRGDRAGNRGRLRGEQGRDPRREQTRPHGETCGDRWGAGAGGIVGR